MTWSSIDTAVDTDDTSDANSCIDIKKPAAMLLADTHRVLTSIASFRSAELVLQKRLKANSAQMLRIANAIDPLIRKYHTTLSLHIKRSRPQACSYTNEMRKRARSNISETIEQYDQVVEERRKMIEEDGALLELASEIPCLKLNDILLQAIDLQIIVTKDLEEGFETRRSRQGWNAFKVLSA
jgi:hypothetical protein